MWPQRPDWSGSWFVVFSETRMGVTHAHTYSGQTENIQAHRPVFILRQSSDFCQEFKLCFRPQSGGALPVHICLCGRAAFTQRGFIIASDSHAITLAHFLDLDVY